MAVALELQAHSFRESLRRYWLAFSKTVIGDVVATAIAITGMAVLFLACSYAVILLTRVAGAVMQLVGA